MSTIKEKYECGFIHLHTHSDHSLLRGTASIPQLVKKAKSLGYPALALTDVNQGGALILFLQECRKEGIQPLLGVEWQHEKDENDRLVLLAKNQRGYQELCRLTTAFLCSSVKKPLYQFFDRKYANLFVFTSYPSTLHALHHTEMSGQLYGELISTGKESRLRSSEIETMADHLGIPLVATGDVYFLEKMDWNFHKLLRAIGLNKNVNEMRLGDFESPLTLLKSEEDMKWVFQRRLDAIQNTVKIWQQCKDDLQQQPWIMPQLPGALAGSEAQTLRELAFAGLQDKYGGTETWELAQKRLEKELKIIHDKGYDAYFLMVRELRLWANHFFSDRFRQPQDCTTLRGSAANSLTLYCIGGSDLDPIRYNLYFERFLNPDRKSPPDVDLDFGWDERDEVLQHVFDLWGRENVAIMCTTNRFKWKSAFRVVAKAYGYHPSEINDLITRIGVQNFRAGSKEIQSTPRDPLLSEIHYYAQLLLGKPHHLSQHCGGVIVTNDPIANHLICQPSPGDDKRMITQIDMHSGIDFLGLIKFDFLGNGSLSVLRDALKQIEEQGLPDPEVWDLEKCFRDEGVKKLLIEGESRGIFYLESPAQSRLNRKAQVESFEEIGITSSLIRPAGTSYADTYIERNRAIKRGEKDWEFLHPSLKEILKETHDVCVYQEDIIRICVEVAGLSFKEADRVRKMMNSMHEGVPEDYEYIAERFKQGCMAKNEFKKDQAEELWQRIQSFQGFSFCKSHSLSYAQLSYQCAYLKAHYPAQFLAAVLSNHHGFYTQHVYLDEARRMKIDVLAPCVNDSDYKYKGQGKQIRFGFVHVRGVRKKAIKNLLLERKQRGRFHSFADFVLRNAFFREKEIEVLIHAGGMKGFGANGAVLLEWLQKLRNPSAKEQMAPMFYEQVRIPSLRFPQSFSELLQKEFESTETFFSINLLESIRRHPAFKKGVFIDRLRFYVGKEIRVFGFPIARRVHRVQKTGKEMLFVSLQDHTGVLDVVVWPETLRNYKIALLEKDTLQEFRGIIQEEYGSISLELKEVLNHSWREILPQGEVERESEKAKKVI